MDNPVTWRLVVVALLAGVAIAFIPPYPTGGPGVVSALTQAVSVLLILVLGKLAVGAGKRVISGIRGT